MSVLQEQHARWAEARGRLGGGATFPVVVPYRQSQVAPVSLLGEPSWRRLVILAALKNGVSGRDVLSPDRRTSVVAARYSAMRLLESHCGFDADYIGRLMGRDRTTVLHALGRLKSRAVAA